MWFLKGVGSNFITRGERDIYLWGVPLTHRVLKEVELREDMEWGSLSSFVFP
jgi:hypothetical protein